MNEHNPTNQKLHEEFKKHNAMDELRLAALEEAILTRPDEQRIREIFSETLSAFFSTKGTTIKSFLIGTAMIVGALTVILGGVKAILGWLGFSYIIK